MLGCEKAAKKGCNAFQWNGKEFELYKATKMTGPAPGYIAFIDSGTALRNNGYLWGMKNGAKLTGYDNDTAYKTITAAAKACTTSNTCKVCRAGLYRILTTS